MERVLIGAFLVLVLACAPIESPREVEDGSAPADSPAHASELLSWNDGAAREAILSFVAQVTNKAGLGWVPPEERIAVFDNDGTLWSEQPAYFQLLFAVDRVRDLADEHPEWKSQQPFKGALEGDLEAVAASGTSGVLELLMASHAGMTSAEFTAIAADWFATARHPTLDRPYTELAYQPMLELLDYLRANGFKTFIVSGGGIEMMRVFSQEVYGIPPEQVVGSSIKTQYENREDGPVLVRVDEIDFIDDKEGKPVGIHRHIGRRPILAFGNSDGDQQMLQWTAAGDGPRFIGIVRHTDADREWAYDRDSHIGRLDAALDEAEQRGWTVVDMRQDWKTIYSPSSP